MAEPFVITLHGTSLTSSYQDRGWPLVLRQTLQAGKQSRVFVHSTGKGGANSNWGLANINNVIRHQPDVALIEFINDGHQSFQAPNPEGMTPDKSRRNFTQMIDAIRSKSPRTRICLMTLIRPRADIANGLYSSLPGYYGLLPDLARSKGVGFIDCCNAWGDPALHPSEWVEDGLHPELPAFKRVSIPTIAREIAPLIP